MMTLKDKIILVLLSIITLGIYPLIIFRKKTNKSKSELSTANKITINLNKLRNELGGEKNIIGSEYTHTKVKIFLKDYSIINIENIKEIKGISGVFASSKSITIIVGNQAKQLANKL